MAGKPIYETETVSCYCCGGDDYRVYIPRAKERYNGMEAWFDVVRCRRCGFVFTNPRPTPETIEGFYPDSADYYQPGGAGEIKSQEQRKGFRGRLWRAVLARDLGYPCSGFPEALSGMAAIFLRRKLRLSHIPRYREGGRLLDIGCAWGEYLVKMQRLGWEVYGVEMNQRAAEFARDSLGLGKVRPGTFDDLDYPEGFFDVVHMSMVLEHLYDPADALRKVHRLLKPGGQLILSVPDIEGLEARLFRAHAYTLQVPQHLSHFSPRTLGRFLRGAGFRRESICHQKTRKDFLKSLEYLDRPRIFRIANGDLFKSLILSPWLELLARLGRTSRMSVFAVKAET